MKIKNINIRKVSNDDKVMLTSVGSGYLQGDSGSLPDVDIDFQSDKRQDVKEYLERRYDRKDLKRVFSAGTMHVLKIKATLKYICDIHGVPRHISDKASEFIKDGDITWTGLMMLAFDEKSTKGGRKFIYNFIQNYPQVVSDMRYIMGQPRIESSHPSAIIVTPDHKDGKPAECYDFLPLKKIGDVLVSEIDGYSIDDIGLLKNDVLSTDVLTQIKAMIDIVKREYGVDISLSKVANSPMDDPKTYEVLSNGYTQNVFQFGSSGMTRFITEMKPNCIHDLIAATSLFRPAALSSGSAEKYNDCKHGIIAPTYLWGTHDILKETHGVLAYQEQLAQMAREIGGFTIGEGVNLVKLISKKNTEKIHAMRGKFMDGAIANGCPKEDAEGIWDMIESGGSYLFNRSHATAYSMISYVSAYVKANYPTVFYTVSLDFTNDKKLPSLMTEMDAYSTASIVAPDINVSGDRFISDYKEGKIFWSLSRISHIGQTVLPRIMEDREVFGEYTSMNNFIDRLFVERVTNRRIFDLRHVDTQVVLSNGETFENGAAARKYLEEIRNRSFPEAVEILNDIKLTGRQWEYIERITQKGVRNPINTRHVQHLIMSGCFDNLENIKAVADRWVLIQEASKQLGFVISEKTYPPNMVSKHYFWSSRQVELSGMGSIDYRRVYNNLKNKDIFKRSGKYLDLPEMEQPESDGRTCTFCATIQNVRTFSYTCKKTGVHKTSGRIMLSQNKSLIELTVWSDIWEGGVDSQLTTECEGMIVVGSARVQYNDYQKKNQLNSNNNSKFVII